MSIHYKGMNALKYLRRMHPAGLEPATCNLEGCCSIPTELRMLTIGLEPILPKGTDFKSVVFTNFTKRAKLGNQSPCFEISNVFFTNTRDFEKKSHELCRLRKA